MLPGAPVSRLAAEEFRLFRDLINDHCGIFFDDNALPILERRLAKRLSLLELSGFREYFQLLRYGRNREEELSDLMDLLTTNETYFFREICQLRALTDEIIPEILNRRELSHEPNVLRIWSAGCSSGEEPYTVAMLLLEAGYSNDCRIEIIGTDISHRVLHQARRGVYGPSSFRTTEEYFRRKYFLPHEEGYRICDRVRDLVTISHLNLLDEGRMLLLGRMDVILCRNVILYFERDSRKRVAEAFSRALREGGYLLLGHADSLMNISTAFVLRHLMNDMVYQKPMGVNADGYMPCVK